MKIAICAIIKDEHRYLDEWIQYHLNLGFDEIYLYEDFGSLSHKDICKKYENVIINSMGLFEKHRLNPKRQTILYKWFIERYNNNFDWVAFIDIDEFIMLEDNIVLKELLDEYKDEQGLYMYWKMYSANNLVEPPKDFSVLNTYTEVFETDKVEITLAKSFVNFKNNGKLLTHHLVKHGVNSKREQKPRNVTYEKIWINHYYTKSWTEWLLRMFKRGNLYFDHQRILDFFIFNPKMKEQMHELVSNMGEIVRKYS